MRLPVALLGIAAALGLGACASTPEARLRNEVFHDVYWGAARECEARYRTLNVDRIGVDGSLKLSAAANSRIEAGAFRDCYWQAVPARVERRRAAGLAVPEGISLHPDIDFD
jgi:hypothetical protein